MTQKKDTIKLLKRWLKRNSAPYLAWKLGYKTTSAIDNWIERDNIPRWIEPRIIEIIEMGDVNQ